MHSNKIKPISFKNGFLLRVKELMSSITIKESERNKINTIAINEAAIHADKKVVIILTIIYLFELP